MLTLSVKVTELSLEKIQLQKIVMILNKKMKFAQIFYAAFHTGPPKIPKHLRVTPKKPSTSVKHHLSGTPPIIPGSPSPPEDPLAEVSRNINELFATVLNTCKVFEECDYTPILLKEDVCIKTIENFTWKPSSTKLVTVNSDGSFALHLKSGAVADVVRDSAGNLRYWRIRRFEETTHEKIEIGVTKSVAELSKVLPGQVEGRGDNLDYSTKGLVNKPGLDLYEYEERGVNSSSDFLGMVASVLGSCDSADHDSKAPLGLLSILEREKGNFFSLKIGKPTQKLYDVCKNQFSKTSKSLECKSLKGFIQEACKVMSSVGDRNTLQLLILNNNRLLLELTVILYLHAKKDDKKYKGWILFDKVHHFMDRVCPLPEEFDILLSLTLAKAHKCFINFSESSTKHEFSSSDVVSYMDLGGWMGKKSFLRCKIIGCTNPTFTKKDVICSETPELPGLFRDIITEEFEWERPWDKPFVYVAKLRCVKRS